MFFLQWVFSGGPTVLCHRRSCHQQSYSRNQHSHLGILPKCNGRFADPKNSSTSRISFLHQLKKTKGPRPFGPFWQLSAPLLDSDLPPLWSRVVSAGRRSARSSARGPRRGPAPARGRQRRPRPSPPEPGRGEKDHIHNPASSK